MQAPTGDDVRRQKEAAFHDQWAGDVDVQDTLVDETFTSITALENQHVLEVFGDVRGLSVLDYGCGAAEGGIFLAKRGARVVAVDVSQGMLDVAQQLAARHGVQIETRLVTSERIPGADGEFDRIYGNGVLHHVPLATTIPELARILKPEGVACFIEPLPYNPLINVYRRIATEVRTDDEKPISFQQIEQFRAAFERVEHREFWLTALAVFLKFFLWDRVHPNQERYWKKIYTDAPRLERFFAPLKALDEQLLDRAPVLGRLCWNTVITVARPRKPREQSKAR
jgi:SAM-dependent methyltransferase